MILRIIFIIIIFIYFVFVSVDYLRLVKKCQKLESKVKLLSSLTEEEGVKKYDDIMVESNAEDSKD